MSCYHKKITTLNNQVENLFFELLQVAIGCRKDLSKVPSDREWYALYDLAEKHSVIGVCFAGIERLPKEQHPPMDLLMDWLGQAEYIKTQNEEVNKAIPEVCSRFLDKTSVPRVERQASGFKPVVLKGQGLAQLYNANSDSNSNLGLLRTSGDIDVLIGDCMPSDGLIRKVCEVATANGTEYLHATYHHCDFGKVAGVEVEAHWRASWFYTPWYNRRFQRFCNSSLDSPSTCSGTELSSVSNSSENHSIPTPSLAFNRVYVLVHIYRHLFSEGIGLRQLLDYYMVLRASAVSKVSEFQVSGDDDEKPRNKKQETAEGNPFWPQEKIETMQRLRELGMERFTAAVMWVLGYCFANSNPNSDSNIIGSKQGSLSYQDWMLCEPNEKDGRFLLQEIMVAGNFGKHDDRYARRKDESYPRYALRKVKRNVSLFRFGAWEMIWTPLWRIWHICWWMRRHNKEVRL